MKTQRIGAVSLSVVIPCKAGESRLNRTIQKIRETAPHADIIVVFDGVGAPADLPEDVRPVVLSEPRGTQYARHAGIMAATGEVVFSCDAHMDFQPGWELVLRMHLAANPASVACFKMCAMEEGHESWMDARSVYKGASINWTVRENNGFHGALVGKWADNCPGEISCVMGACYGFRKERYLEINQPWSLGTGWGCDEETISAVNWLCGGTIDLLDHYIGHYMGKPASTTAAEGDKVWANRMRLLYMLPLEDAHEDELFNWLRKNSAAAARWSKIHRLCGTASAVGFRLAAPYTRTAADWIERFELKPRKEVEA